jgi:hypothetical protein
VRFEIFNSRKAKLKIKRSEIKFKCSLRFSKGYVQKFKRTKNKVLFKRFSIAKKAMLKTQSAKIKCF